jgi:hypothetical protein
MYLLSTAARRLRPMPLTACGRCGGGGLPRAGAEGRRFSSESQGGRRSVAELDALKGGESERAVSKITLLPPKGTRDFYPADQRLQAWLFGHWRRVAALHGFEEYGAPVLEHEALYQRKAGDDISQQLYSFEDKSGRRLSLRPEMTPSLARMVMARLGQLQLSLPLKWFSIPQCWRYERMSRGRRREHYQVSDKQSNATALHVTLADYFFELEIPYVILCICSGIWMCLGSQMSMQKPSCCRPPC